jgi:hypothetical protein
MSHASAHDETMTIDELEALGEEIATFAARIDVATHALITRLRTFDEHEGWGRLRFPTCAHWLSWRTGIGLNAAREKVRVARALGELPKVDALFGKGELSYSKVRAITRVATKETEQDFIDIAMNATASQTERLTQAYRRTRKDDDDTQPKPRRFVRRSDTFGGMVRIDMQLPPEEAQIVWDAMMSAMDADACTKGAAETSNMDVVAADEGSPSERRAETSGLEREPAADDTARAPAPEAETGGTPRASHADLGPVHGRNHPAVGLSAEAPGPEREAAGDVTAEIPGLEREGAGDVTAEIPEPEREVAGDVTAEISGRAGRPPAAADGLDRPPGCRHDACAHGPVLPANDGAEHEEARADAMVNLARAYLRGRPRTLGSGYELVVLTTPEGLAKGRSGVGGLMRDGTPVPLEVARMLACDGTRVDVTTGEQGELLDVGRGTRTIPPAIARALWVRDGCCRVPGCARRRHLQAHHIEHWADGGPTCLPNLVLVCSYHHRHIHEGHLSIEIRGGAFVFLDTRGREIPAAPPSATTGQDLEELERFLARCRRPRRPVAQRTAMGRHPPRSGRSPGLDVRGRPDTRHPCTTRVRRVAFCQSSRCRLLSACACSTDYIATCAQYSLLVFADDSSDPLGPPSGWIRFGSTLGLDPIGLDPGPSGWIPSPYIELEALSRTHPEDFVRFRHLGPSKLHRILSQPARIRRHIRERVRLRVPGLDEPKPLDRMTLRELDLVIRDLAPTPPPANPIGQVMTAYAGRLDAIDTKTDLLIERAREVDRDEARTLRDRLDAIARKLERGLDL